MQKHYVQLVAAGAILAATAAAVTPALATPPFRFARTPLSAGLLHEVEVRAENSEEWELRLRTKDDSTLSVDRLSMTEGGHSGWHTHAGITMVTVIAGEIIRFDGASAGCPSKTYRVGDSFIEPANSPHLIRNTSAGDSAFTAVQMRPNGAPGSINADQPGGCPPS